MPHSPAPLPVAVIGAGFSGTTVALHLAATLPPEQSLLLCDGTEFACGPAYATHSAAHLLNVRASNMSALPDDPAHFESWLAAEPDLANEDLHHGEAGLFVSRRLYRRYLCSLLDGATRRAPARVRTLRADIVDLERDGTGWRLHAADGTTIAAAAAVLAVGNLPPPATESGLFRANPWAPGALANLRPELPLLVQGTGLTMIDIALQCQDGGFPGPVIAVSRRGMLPHRHAAARAWPTPEFTAAELRSLPALLRRLRWEARRAAARGVDWRGVIDSLRPITALIWRELPIADKRRFLRHLRTYWDIHRHRMAPPVAARIEAMLASGYLRIQRGRLLRLEEAGDHADAVIRPRGSGRETRLAVQRAICATGPRALGDSDSPLVRALCRRGLARADTLGFGLDVTDRLEVRDAEGGPVPHLWALGPIVRGVFWECIAVPDIRHQARTVARAAAAALRPE
jgi:uncharacterized NAD(P)/FAD-binding protein YdhS